MWTKIVLVLMMLCLSVACGADPASGRRATPTAGVAAPPTADADEMASEPRVERLTVEVEPGDPPVVYVGATGRIRDRCQRLRPGQAQTTQSGQIITMKLPAELLSPCANSATTFDARLRVPLTAPAPGIYRLQVNGVTVVFQLDADDFQ